MTKEMKILSINDQDYEVVDAAGRTGLAEVIALTGGGSVMGSAVADWNNHAEVNAAAAPLHSCVVDIPVMQDTETGDPTPIKPNEFYSVNYIKVFLGTANHFVLDDSQVGYKLDDEGNISQDSNYLISDFIPVNGSIFYDGVNYGGFGREWDCAWYDQNKNYISSFTITPINGTRTAPSGAKYARFSLQTGDCDDFAVYDSAPTEKTIYPNDPVYHGSYDFLTGKLIRPDVFCTLKDQQDLTFTMNQGANYTTFSVDITDYFPTVKDEGFAQITCDRFKGYDSESTDINSCYLEDGVLYMTVANGTWSSAADFLSWVRINGINFLAELETAEEESYLPLKIETTSGINVIYPRWGELTIEYYKNSSLVRDFITLINDLQ